MPQPLYSIFDSPRLNRRNFLLATSSLAAAALWSTRAFGAVTRRPVFSDYPFQLGVASGDPTSEGVVLWTRLAPRPIDGGGMAPDPVEVSWQIAEDESMNRVVRQGTTVAKSDWAHSVHVEVTGLRPDRWYWYQFKAGNEISPRGRTRTLPVTESLPARLRFAFASCQHYESGYYTAYQHLSGEDLDLVFHLGDYIYEGGINPKTQRHHNSKEIYSLDDYRNRYGLYKADPHLQAAHAMAPWLVTWDDHEVDNNYAGAISEEAGVTPGQLLARRAWAYQAYYEHMPLRRSALPRGPDMKIYRRLSFGRLAQFFILDTRQYRTDQPCGDGNLPPCDEVMNPDATLLGRAQREWLFQGLDHSPAVWNTLAQQVMMARVDRTPGPVAAYSMDQWPGYEMERRRVLNHFRTHQTSNPIVLAGDIHTNWANELLTDFDQPEATPVATEFVGTSISSSGDGVRVPKNLEAMLSDNPFVKFHNAERGYVRCEVTPRQWRTDYQVVEYVTRPGAPLITRQSFAVEAGRPQLKPV